MASLGKVGGAACGWLVMLLVVGCFSSDVSGFALLDFPSDVSVQQGSYKRWDWETLNPASISLSYSVESGFLSSVPGAEQAVHNAVGKWDGACPVISFDEVDYEPVLNTYANLGSQGFEGADSLGANIDIMARPSSFSYTTLQGKTYGFSGGSLAFAAPIAFSGSILSVDIFINSSSTWYTDGRHFDLETVVLHEIGHALGLDHPDQATANGAKNYYPWTNLPGQLSNGLEVMHSGYYPDGINRNLTVDDVGGLAFLYEMTPGDADMDGDVDLADLARLGIGMVKPAPGWSDGDFNGDSTVNISDLSVLASNYGMIGRAPGAQEMPVMPEPSTALMLVVGGCALRRRRSSR